ncbi:hypothetical protein B0T11DRAFT_2651 [Plectosphaerella cucumerina]|uniref:Uncharacterized protein n=1 Tax=Plectosphaerella cucumerina TaxID=40658 RepID=A0A8K0X8L3_9PEZI|nr:hypothetical protein B0T11DRAFT_2651 [Plectosphaerella cucumerina]
MASRRHGINSNAGAEQSESPDDRQTDRQTDGLGTADDRRRSKPDLGCSGGGFIASARRRRGKGHDSRPGAQARQGKARADRRRDRGNCPLTGSSSWAGRLGVGGAGREAPGAAASALLVHAVLARLASISSKHHTHWTAPIARLHPPTSVAPGRTLAALPDCNLPCLPCPRTRGDPLNQTRLETQLLQSSLFLHFSLPSRPSLFPLSLFPFLPLPRVLSVASPHHPSFLRRRFFSPCREEKRLPGPRSPSRSLAHPPPAETPCTCVWSEPELW